MPDFIVIRLHPVKPMDGKKFTEYLNGLTITAFDLSFDNLDGGKRIGVAEYLFGDPKNNVVQHLDFGQLPPVEQAVATAVIAVDLGLDSHHYPEYGKNNIRLDIERNGNKIIDNVIDYNAIAISRDNPPVLNPNPQVLDSYVNLEASLYGTLPAPPVDPNTKAASLDIPADGTPPSFSDLQQAMIAVLSADPGAVPDLGQLTLVQCRYIAYEIVWNRQRFPLPTSPSSSLEQMYTGIHKDGSDEENARQKFEADLLSYYALHNAEADRLYQFVYALVAAIKCEGQSTNATRAGLRFPVVADSSANPANALHAGVILTGLGGPNLQFTVPAQYFYALGTGMSPQITPDQRYQIALLQDENRLLSEIGKAIDLKIIAEQGVNRYQATHRLRALSDAGDTALSSCPLTKALEGLVENWLTKFNDPDSDAFWSKEIKGQPDEYKDQPGAYFELILCLITENHKLLIDAIKARPTYIVDELAAITSQEWQEFFIPPAAPPMLAPPPTLDLLPPFIISGTPNERVAAFIRHLRKFFDVKGNASTPDTQTPGGPPRLNSVSWDPLLIFADFYKKHSHIDLAFTDAWDVSQPVFQQAIADTFPDDPAARVWLAQTLQTIDDLYMLTALDIFTLDDKPELRFSLVEALYARGFTRKSDVQSLTQEDFREALIGTIAYDYADKIHTLVEAVVEPGIGPQKFQSINPNNCLTNCIPPIHLSPLGPVAYLHEMLKLSANSTCEVPFPKGAEDTLESTIASRRGALGELHVTRANFSTPLPLIDIVNECLEVLAANAPYDTAGVVYDTATDTLAGHKLCTDAELADNHATSCHDSATLFATLPEHSSPAAQIAQPAAYDKLRNDFSAPTLPYSQPLDVNRSYLRYLDTSRYALMRRFRKDISEFVLDPNTEPDGFQPELWRYPVRIEIAREYLGINPEEYEQLFAQDILIVPTEGRLLLRDLYGFDTDTINEAPWTQITRRVSEFLKRTGLTYYEFHELWQSQFVKFSCKDGDGSFPVCEPCCLDRYVILFTDPEDENETLKQLIVFIRLWKKLRSGAEASYTFAQLKDICDVLHLFNEGTINPDFIRQLVAFQMLSDHLQLKLATQPNGISDTIVGNSLSLLVLWVKDARLQDTKKWEQTIELLIDRIHHYADYLQCHTWNRQKHSDRSSAFIKIITKNLDPLSRLAGFNPDEGNDTWYALPAHTLRFAEVLAKIYVSDFSVGEILYLFTAEKHLDGDDPFDLQDENEAQDSPFDLPEKQRQHSLWTLRHKLLAVHLSEQNEEKVTWKHIETSLRNEFGVAYSNAGIDPLISLGEHFFPSALESCDHPVSTLKRQYRTKLEETDASLWSTSPDSPFHYETSTHELWIQLPLKDTTLFDTLSCMPQLSPEEQRAVQDLYFSPRVELVPFSFIFSNFSEAVECLIQEEDEKERWAYFQNEFARCQARCKIIAEHLASHVAYATGENSPASTQLAWRLLQHLLADENKAQTSWEDDNGVMPAVTWQFQPNGGAFAALLALTGTGLSGTFTSSTSDKVIIWREVRGSLSAFGHEKNFWNAPIPTILPSMNLMPSSTQERFIDIRNGFVLKNEDGEVLRGSQGFLVCWRGTLLIEHEGIYEFCAGAPTRDGEKPASEPVEQSRWHVSLKKGQKTWIELHHHWSDMQAHTGHVAQRHLRRGAYELLVEFEQPQPAFDKPGTLYPQHTGFQVKYSGPDSEHQLVAIPYNRLYRTIEDKTLGDGINAKEIGDFAKKFLDLHFTSSLRDIRRTYQRAFKALLFAYRFGLSAESGKNHGLSEIDYLLNHSSRFAGASYFRKDKASGGGFRRHLVFFDFNFLPLLDTYSDTKQVDPTVVVQDQRVNPSIKRRQALFDWWERIFDYVQLRKETQQVPEHSLWLLFKDAAGKQKIYPAQLCRHMSVELDHTKLVLHYYQKASAAAPKPLYDVSSENLQDERWAIRVWQAEQWVRTLERNFAAKDIRVVQPNLWAADDPNLQIADAKQSGNENLTQFICDGCFENEAPRRYKDVKQLNDGLRERARTALIAYLCGMKRVLLPWGEGDLYAHEADDLSALLLLDVETGLCEQASRIEEAISAVQLFIQRLRLGLEAASNLTPNFILLWERRFATFRLWEASKRREIYRENWIDWDEIQQAQRSEGFRFLEMELRRSILTAPTPGGLLYWPIQQPLERNGLTFLQASEPALIQQVSTPTTQSIEGFNLLGTPERAARPSWLAAIHSTSKRVDEREPKAFNSATPDLPSWIQSAIQLGTRFIRVAAASEPPAQLNFVPHNPDHNVRCCTTCGQEHAPVIDEYYFWLLDSRYYVEPTQDADWRTNANQSDTDWHTLEMLPKRLFWDGKPMVHLAWCLIHNGEFQQPRRSHEGVRLINNEVTPQLELLGRLGDSLHFNVDGGKAPEGYPSHPDPGFRYDLATDTAILLPMVVAPAPPSDIKKIPGGLTAYPYFVYFAPGARLLPSSRFAPTLAVADMLRAHCNFEAALKWYELAFDPLHSNNSWCVQDDVERPPVLFEGSTPEATVLDTTCGNSVATSNQVALNRSITFHYLETLLQWGDALMRRNVPEAFQQARLIFNTAASILGANPAMVKEGDNTHNLETIINFSPLFAPLNPRLLELYNLVDDRLAMIHTCLDARRLRNAPINRNMSYWGDSPLHNGWQTSTHYCLDEGDWCYLRSPYRFTFLIQKAQELANEVRGLGAELLAAFEKGDAEYLASLRTTHERQLLNLTLEIRQNQWRAADWQVQALQKTKEGALTRKQYYVRLLQHGLISGETQYSSLVDVTLGSQEASRGSELTSMILGFIPDLFAGTGAFTQAPIGTKLATTFSTVARMASSLGESASTTGSRSLTQSGWDRRALDWQQQVDVITIEIEQIERQILAAERQRDIALRELNNHRQQIEQSAEIQDFLRDKFTNHALYLFFQQETASLHHRMYELALYTARQAQHAFNYERGHTSRNFLPTEIWDNLHEGLLAGERLHLSLRQMEKAYLDENVREYEMTKHLSLRRDFPHALLLLKETGSCEIEIPEWMFDLDYPGHYMRRIKNVTLTIPCVVGPYTTVHSRLTLLHSTTRVDPRLNDPSTSCCGENESQDGYQVLSDDPRIFTQYAATEAIATSSGQNDAGLFELSFRDERYLPFEFTGAISRWRIDLPEENNQFDIDTLTDLILHLNYTAREGGDVLRRVANKIAQHHLLGAGLRFFDVKHEFPDAWHRFQVTFTHEKLPKWLGLRLDRNMFPFLPHHREVLVNRLEILFEAPTAKSNTHHIVEFLTGHTRKQEEEEGEEGEAHEIRCIASTEWPGLYHGFLDVHLEPLNQRRERELGAFRFPHSTGIVTRAFLFCGYEVIQKQSSRRSI